MRKFIVAACAIALAFAWSGVPAFAADESVKDKAKDKMDTAKEKVGNAWDKTKEKAVEAKDKVKEKVSGKKDKGGYHGIIFVVNAVPTTPPYVEEVTAGSPAAAAKLKADDLIVYVDGNLIGSIKGFLVAAQLPEHQGGVVPDGGHLGIKPGSSFVSSKSLLIVLKVIVDVAFAVPGRCKVGVEVQRIVVGTQCLVIAVQLTEDTGLSVPGRDITRV